MASDSPKTRRAIGAVLLVVVAFAVAMRLSMKHEPEEADAAQPLAPESAAPLPVVSSSSPRQGTGALAHYVSGLLPKGIHILAISSGAGTAIAVGEHGVVFRYKLDDPTWKADPPVTDKTLRGVAQQLDRAVAVGDDGTILELDGGHWSLAPRPTERTLRAVVYSSYGAVAIGDDGTIVTQLGEGQAWRAESSGSKSDLFGACAGLRDLWVVGRSGATLLRGPEGWKVLPPVTTSTLYATACDDHAAVAVGEQGTVLERLDDVGWHAKPSGMTADLFGVSAPMGTRSFIVVGASGTILHITNDVTAEAQAVSWTLRAATDGALGTWVAGDEGVLRRATN